MVPKGQLVAKALRAGWDQMQMMRAAAWVGLAKPVHLLAPIRRVEITELGQWLKAGPGGLQALDTDEDVDDRLGVQARYRGAADVVNPAGGPPADRSGKRQALQLESAGPL